MTKKKICATLIAFAPRYYPSMCKHQISNILRVSGNTAINNFVLSCPTVFPAVLGTLRFERDLNYPCAGDTIKFRLFYPLELTSRLRSLSALVFPSYRENSVPWLAAVTRESVRQNVISVPVFIQPCPPRTFHWNLLQGMWNPAISKWVYNNPNISQH